MNAAICFDFDGTIADERGKIHPADREILERRRDVLFIAASGRPLHSIKRGFEENGLFVGGPIPIPMVLQNGATNFNSGEEPWDRHFFDAAVQDELMRGIAGFPAVTFFMFTADLVYTLGPDGAGGGFVRRFALDTREYSPDFRDVPFTKFICFSDSDAELSRFSDSLEGVPVERYYSLPRVFEVNPRGIDKGTMSVALLRRMGIGGADIYAAGDAENDLPLFDMAKKSYAPAGSHESICRRADMVINTMERGLLRPIMDDIGIG